VSIAIQETFGDARCGHLVHERRSAVGEALFCFSPLTTLASMHPAHEGVSTSGVIISTLCVGVTAIWSGATTQCHL
jgi:hypothetical protein